MYRKISAALITIVSQIGATTSAVDKLRVRLDPRHTDALPIGRTTESVVASQRHPQFHNTVPEYPKERTQSVQQFPARKQTQSTFSPQSETATRAAFATFRKLDAVNSRVPPGLKIRSQGSQPGPRVAPVKAARRPFLGGYKVRT